MQESIATFAEPGTSVIVTGSVGRGEMTNGSDLDWMLLVDSASDPNHMRLAQEVGQTLKSLDLKQHGREQTFGGLVSSHDLVHYIAGSKDTNDNLTRRILLLVESKAITNERVREQVLGNILARYVFHDRSLPSRSGDLNRVPHFLLNDTVRYWRTMASDFASKMWDRHHDGWAIRNIKLRFSRKLLFVAGLLIAFSAERNRLLDFGDPTKPDEFLTLLANHIREQADVPPLVHLARALEGYPDLGKKILGAYDVFLATIGDDEKRERLERLGFDDASKDPTYEHVREESHAFREGIEELFFDRDEVLRRLIRKVGVS